MTTKPEEYLPISHQSTIVKKDSYFCNTAHFSSFLLLQCSKFRKKYAREPLCVLRFLQKDLNQELDGKYNYRSDKIENCCKNPMQISGITIMVAS